MCLIILTIVLSIIAFVFVVLELFYPDKLWMFHIYPNFYFFLLVAPLVALIVTIYMLFFSLIFGVK